MSCKGYFWSDDEEGFMYELTNGEYYFFLCFKGEGFYYREEESEYWHAEESLYYRPEDFDLNPQDSAGFNARTINDRGASEFDFTPHDSAGFNATITKGAGDFEFTPHDSAGSNDTYVGIPKGNGFKTTLRNPLEFFEDSYLHCDKN